MSQEQVSYPISVKGELSQPPGRGWWLLYPAFSLT
jgi:hypothetical protein